MVKTVDSIPGCAGCPMQQKYPKNTFVEPFKGTNKRLILAEAPGEIEAVQGTPLCGGAGKVAASLYAKAGIQFKDCSKLNVIQCRPPKNDFPDSPEARAYCTKAEGDAIIKHCIKAHTKPFIESQDWARIDVLGSVPLKHIAKLDGGITRWRGSIVEVDTDGI